MAVITSFEYNHTVFDITLDTCQFDNKNYWVVKVIDPKNQLETGIDFRILSTESVSVESIVNHPYIVELAERAQSDFECGCWQLLK